MRKPITWNRSLGVVMVLLFSCGNGFSQETKAPKQGSAKQGTAKQGTAKQTLLSDLDAIAAEYRELVCSRAADASYAGRLAAIEIALKQRYVDSRFDSIIREVLEASQEPGRWDPSEILLAHKMLPLSTLSSAEKTGLVFRCYIACEDPKANFRVIRVLRGQLEKSPDETSRLVLEHIESGGDFEKVLPLVDIVGVESDKILPRLLELARSDDLELANYAMAVIPDLISQVKQRVISGVDTAAMLNAGLEKVDPKFVAYSERIVKRYDKNSDRMLSPSEYKSMLMSPADSDLDKNGLITITEYAIWMQSRAKR